MADDTYSSGLLANTGRAASDEHNFARHVWNIHGCERGTTRKEAFINDGAEGVHVVYDVEMVKLEGIC